MKIFCIGRNYANHSKELNNEIPSEPVIFMKPKSALVLPPTGFFYPEFTNELHYEGELVLRICKNGRYIRPHHAHRFYDAVSVGIDFTARDLQEELKKKGLPWEKAKAWDGSAAVGKWIQLKPENRRNISFALSCNGEIVQEANSNELIFSFDKVIATISRYFSLHIGDLIFTGTPAGAGECVIGDQFEGFLNKEKIFQLEIK